MRLGQYAGCLTGRRLSDAEWSDLLQNVDVLGLGLPPWGGLIDYAGMTVLVLIGPTHDDGSVTNWVVGRPTTSEIFLTDISSCPEFAATLKRYGSYNPDSSNWVTHLPAEAWDQTKTVIVSAAVNAPSEIQAKLQEAIEAASRAVGSGLKPLLEPLTPILIGALVVLALMYLPRGHN